MIKLSSLTIIGILFLNGIGVFTPIVTSYNEQIDEYINLNNSSPNVIIIEGIKDDQEKKFFLNIY